MRAELARQSGHFGDRGGRRGEHAVRPGQHPDPHGELCRRDRLISGLRGGGMEGGMLTCCWLSGSHFQGLMELIARPWRMMPHARNAWSCKRSRTYVGVQLVTIGLTSE